MKTKKEKILALLLSFTSMVILGLILECYRILQDEKITLDIHRFNNIVLKSFVISFVVLLVIIASNYKKFKNE